jgi:hypothetical protein
MAAIGAQITESVTERFVVLRYSIDSEEYAETRHAEVSDCEVVVVRERGESRKERNAKSHCGNKGGNEEQHANAMCFRNRLSGCQVTLGKDASHDGLTNKRKHSLRDATITDARIGD